MRPRPPETPTSHFWTNDVVGNLQGEYDRVWAQVAGYFTSNPWILGYDPFNEPFSKSLVTHGDEQFDRQLECFYTGTAMIGRPAARGTPDHLPANDPAAGVIPQIQAADPSHLVFYEPDIFGSRGRPNFVGPMAFPNLVFNVHVYCSYRSGKTGNPTDITACADQGVRTLNRARSASRGELASAYQPKGPGLVRQRVRRHLEQRAPRPAHGGGRPDLGRMDLLVVEVLRGPDRECRRGVARPQRAPSVHCSSAGPHLSPGHSRTTHLTVVRPGQWRLPARLCARPRRPRAHHHLRADTDPLPERLLRTGLGRNRDLRAGQPGPPGRQRAHRAGRSRQRHRPGSCPHRSRHSASMQR